MACMEHECLNCGYFDADNSPQWDSCPQCGSTNVVDICDETREPLVRTIHPLPFPFGGQVAKLFDLGATEKPMTTNPVQSKQEELDAKAWGEFGLCLDDLTHHVTALPITPLQKQILVGTCEYMLRITEFLEGQ